MLSGADSSIVQSISRQKVQQQLVSVFFIVHRLLDTSVLFRRDGGMHN